MGAMSDRPNGEGWWLASDGKWYPPESRPNPPPPPESSIQQAAPVGLSAGLTTAVTVFFWIVMAASAFACYASIDEIGKFNEAFDFPSSRTLNGLLDAEDLTQAATGSSTLWASSWGSS